MTTTLSTDSSTQQPTSGQTVTLAEYVTGDTHEQRRLVGQRIDGLVQVRDEPASGHGTSYLVEEHLESKAALDALVADYLAKAERVGFAPMHGWF